MEALDTSMSASPTVKFWGSVKEKYKKIQDKYYKDQSTIVQLLEPEEFEFKQLDWSEHERL